MYTLHPDNAWLYYVWVLLTLPLIPTWSLLDLVINLDMHTVNGMCDSYVLGVFSLVIAQVVWLPVTGGLMIGLTYWLTRQYKNRSNIMIIGPRRSLKEICI